ncbi:MAG: caspase family protein, partial [Thermoguttaceae bacterium]|nr:caspase family protein [Thermoguttaceae bacterium]
ERLAKTEARFKWVVVDACREEIDPSVAATANSTSERRRGGLGGDSTTLGLLDAPSGSVILQSCDEGQYSYEDDVLKHGVFTYCLAESLTSKGDINGDGEITLLEAVTRTSTETKRAKPTQTPYFDIEATDVRLIAGIKTDGAKPQVDALTQTSNGTTKTNAPSAPRVADRTTPNVANDADARAWDRATQAGERNALTIGDVECAFRWVPPGTFAMGTPDD